ncbi:hypothetical protein BBW65_07090 [Helicobacter enhydrae]|uniref:DUF1018 domain-containing protein n=1 Tax=Helicobacter enhydrae TaxID=222136 RepID=A0A1B1U6Z9_9HELI|nr:phage protein GemA/Gp16 family protein [Helicobacter enhydrae]ANV98303.1 hypothetical protein BBW65_05595 [Helicobacter enhydrae]ANV98573.1 hypothetical protein BBW65_07090 [Helicobacter enhydrae]
MTEKQRQYRNALLRKIHTHPKYKEIKGAQAWGDYLYVRFGVSSSKELGIEELLSLIDSLNGYENGRGKDIRGRVMLFGSRQDQKIALLLEDLGMRGMIGEFIYRQTKKRTLEECSTKEKTKIIIGLEKIKRERQ